MFIQYGNQNGFCVRPRGEGGVSFEIYTHSPIHTNFHPSTKIVGIFGMGWNLQKHIYSHTFSFSVLKENWRMCFSCEEYNI